MIGKLRGILDSITDERCVIDVAGVGYVVFLSSKTANFLSRNHINEEFTLIIETVIKEDAIELYGFVSEIEKVWFLELLKVQGVGAKMAQKILSALAIEDLAKALISSDIKTFTQISGIGPKLAARITTELKTSPNKLGVDTAIINSGKKITEFLQNSIAIDALSALENLGYRKHDCLSKIDFLIGQNPQITLENLITASLRELSKSKS